MREVVGAEPFTSFGGESLREYRPTTPTGALLSRVPGSGRKTVPYHGPSSWTGSARSLLWDRDRLCSSLGPRLRGQGALPTTIRTHPLLGTCT